MAVPRLVLALILTTVVTGQKRELTEQLNQAAEIRAKVRAFDIDRDNYFEAVADAISNIVRNGLSKGGGAVSTILRFTTMLNVARFDANAPYTATAVGITTQLSRRPPAEHTLRNKNLACIYAGYRVLMGVIPQESELILQLMYDLGLDPNDDRENDYSPIGIGNTCGNNVCNDRRDDGANEMGDADGRRYNLEPYADYTGYEPVNTGKKLVDPSRWQPYVESNGKGMFRTQEFVTPQCGLVRPFVIDNVDKFEVGPHKRILRTQEDLAAYQASTDEVIHESAALTDEKKMKAEFYEDKIKSVLGSVMYIVNTQGFDIDRFNEIELISNMAMYDTTIIVWKEKRRWDAVRPFSAIRYLYGDKPITAWGGPYNGTVYGILGKEWRHYLPVADHPEYPSASTGACVSHAEAMRLYLGSDELAWTVGFERGESTIEPGFTPSHNLSVFIPTFSHFGNECGQSRLWAGVHFQDAIDSIKDIAKAIARSTVDFVLRHAKPVPASFEQRQPQHIQELPPVVSPFASRYSLFSASTAPVTNSFNINALTYGPDRGPRSDFNNHFSFTTIGKKKKK